MKEVTKRTLSTSLRFEIKITNFVLLVNEVALVALNAASGRVDELAKFWFHSFLDASSTSLWEKPKGKTGKTGKTGKSAQSTSIRESRADMWEFALITFDTTSG